MKKYVSCLIRLVLAMVLTGALMGAGFLTPALAGAPAEDGPYPSSSDPSSKEDQISYAIGYDIGVRLKEYLKLNAEFFNTGIQDALEGQPKISPDDMKQLLMDYRQMVREKQQEKTAREVRKNRSAGELFLSENAGRERVILLPSGLQYKVLQKGEGPVPEKDDTVECHYRGALIDGTVFDSSYEREKPAVFQVGGVIAGWTQALEIMPVGSKWTLYIPPDLAYGDQGVSDMIPPGSTLIFQIELLGIVRQQK